MPATRAILVKVALLSLFLAGCALLVGCGGGGGGPAATASIMGIIADNSTLVGLSGAVVSIAGKSSLPTDAAGRFSLSGLSVGTSAYTVVLTGYNAATNSVTLPAGVSDLGTLYLQPVTTTGLGNISGVILSTGTTVAGASVRAGGKMGFSKSDGSYALYNITPGNVTVSASSGSQSGFGVVNVIAGTTASLTINISLGPPPPPF